MSTVSGVTVTGRQSEPVDDSKPVCRSETETGSRFTHRVCHTPSQWSQMGADAKAQVDYYQQRAGSYAVGH